MARIPDGTRIATTVGRMAHAHRDPVLEEVRSSFRSAAAITATLAALAVGVLVASGIDRWRLWVAAIALGVGGLSQALLMVRLDRAGDLARGVAVLVGLASQGAVYAVTGGLQSPLLPTLAAAVTGPLVGMGAPRLRLVTLLAVAAVLGGLAALPAGIRTPIVPWPYGGALAALSIAWAVLVVRGSAQRIEAASRRAADAIDELRGERINEALAQARRLQSVGAKVAHELKNPLAAIKGLVQLLSRSAADSHARERLDVVQSEVERMETILREYLSFSRPLEDLHPAPMALASLIADVVSVLSARAEAGGVRLGSSGEASTVQADRRRLKEALINLVSNAIEATPPGGRVDLSFGPDGDGARIEVRDTGRGISPDDMTRLGQSYFTTREGGTGLGFVLAKSAIEQHGGRIEVDSRVGEGTTMRVVLPATVPKREEAKPNG